jgi:hypothetical protein
MLTIFIMVRDICFEERSFLSDTIDPEPLYALHH